MRYLVYFAFTLADTALALAAAKEKRQFPFPSGIDTTSALAAIQSAVPGTVIAAAFASPSAYLSSLNGDLAAGATPSYFVNLPPDIQTLLLDAAQNTSSTITSSTITTIPSGTSTTGSSTITSTTSNSTSSASTASSSDTSTPLPSSILISSTTSGTSPPTSGTGSPGGGPYSGAIWNNTGGASSTGGGGGGGGGGGSGPKPTSQFSGVAVAPTVLLEAALAGAVGVAGLLVL